MGHLALEAPRHEINSFINRIDKDMVGLGQGAQVGKFSCRTLEALRHESNICIKRIDKEMIGLGHGAQIWKEAPRHEINSF